MPAWSWCAGAGAGVTSALKLLKDKTHLRVISHPSITAMNRTPATIFNGEQIPYVGSITPPVTTGTTVTNGSSTLSFAGDGLSLSVIPDILTDQQVDITLVPVLSTVKELVEFDIGGGMKLTGPRQSRTAATTPTSSLPATAYRRPPRSPSCCRPTSFPPARRTPCSRRRCEVTAHPVAPAGASAGRAGAGRIAGCGLARGPNYALRCDRSNHS